MRWVDNHISELTWGSMPKSQVLQRYCLFITFHCRKKNQTGPCPFQAPQKHNESLSTERAQGGWVARWWESSGSTIVRSALGWELILSRSRLRISRARRIVPRNVNSLLLLHLPFDIRINIFEDRIEWQWAYDKMFPIKCMPVS